MIFIDKLKIYILCALSLVGYIQARSISTYQFGDIRIELTNNKWLCDKIECPADTYRCYVSKTNEKDPSVLVRTDICYSKDNKPLAEDVTSTAVDPNSKIKLVIDSDRNGVTTTSNYDSNQKIDEEQLKKEMAQLESDLENMHKEIQANLQEEMKHLEESLSDMQNGLAHMFD